MAIPLVSAEDVSNQYISPDQKLDNLSYSISFSMDELENALNDFNKYLEDSKDYLGIAKARLDTANELFKEILLELERFMQETEK